jgi:hypothetical protein
VNAIAYLDPHTQTLRAGFSSRSSLSGGLAFRKRGVQSLADGRFDLRPLHSLLACAQLIAQRLDPLR